MERPRCAHCQDVIGTYEPARVMLADGTELTGSFLSMGEKLEDPGSVALHSRCYDVFKQGRAEAAG